MLGIVKLRPWSSTDTQKIMDWCKLNDYQTSEDNDGNVCIDLEKSGPKASRSTLLQGLRNVAKYEQLMSTTAESLDLLRDLLNRL
jgi:hypothetical protein